ncbi:hypothetical protein ABBQ32_005168 [Trebouxia sp. C0010 RCD-2024]
MALRLPPLKVASVPQALPTVFSAAQSAPNQPQPIADATAEALMQADANLKKRIVKLATKLENERDARMELEQRVSQSLEAAGGSSQQQSPFRRTSRTNAASPLSRQAEPV